MHQQAYMSAVPLPPPIEHFLVDRAEVSARLQNIDPRAYDKTRNHLDGAVTWLGPFLTHGITNTSEVASVVLERYRPSDCYRLLFELAWREFFHRTWHHHGDEIFSDMREDPAPGRHQSMPVAVRTANTGIDTVDACIGHLLEHGLMHNHARMWVAAITCNQANTHWKEPARWLYAHLLDGDLASNTLSWQWIAGTFSDKQYRANQDNIDRYSGRQQVGSWLDVGYEELPGLSPPEQFRKRDTPLLDGDSGELPGQSIDSLQFDKTRPVLLRSLWSLNPEWQSGTEQQIVFIDEELAARWPWSAKRWRFVQHWANACGAALYHGSVPALQQALKDADVTRMEYSGCEDWPGTVKPRDWLFPDTERPSPSFSRYWKQVRGAAGL